MSEAIANYIATSLDEVTLKSGLKTAAFHWNQWNDGQKKKSFLQNELILAMFANAHLAHLATDHPGDEKLIGVLILLMQAVGHALLCYTTGLLKQNHTPASHFLADNYGDRVEHVEIPSGHRKFKQRRDNRATQYVATVKAFKEDHWNDIFEISRGLMSQKRKSRPSLSSCASSEVIILLSDD